LVRALRVSSRDAEQAVGLSGAQLFVLQCLARQSPCSVNELAARTATDQSSVSVVVSKLVEGGSIKRVTSSIDRRRAELSLTAKGKALLSNAPEAVQDRLLTALQELRPSELAQLSRLLGKVLSLSNVDTTSVSLFFEDRSARSAEPARRRHARA
jgi:DNA-binding MarR family transcriptional regulator